MTPGDQLKQALMRFCAAGGVAVTAATVRSRGWRSVALNGDRHEIELSLDGPDVGAVADLLIAQLALQELPLRGHILADVALLADDRADGAVRLSFEALTVEDSR